MTTTIALNSTLIQGLDLTPVQIILEEWLKTQRILDHEQDLQFQIDYPQAPEDDRELSEIPEVRLWFIRLDGVYPWLPLLLDWRSGELVRYAAMLVPHQFSPQAGIQFNPEALDIFLMGKIFVLEAWLYRQGITSSARLKQMAELFGYELDSELFQLLQANHH